MFMMIEQHLCIFSIVLGYITTLSFSKILTIPKIDDFLGDIPYDNSYIFSIDPKGTLIQMMRLVLNVLIIFMKLVFI